MHKHEETDGNTAGRRSGWPARAARAVLALLAAVPGMAALAAPARPHTPGAEARMGSSTAQQGVDWSYKRTDQAKHEGTVVSRFQIWAEDVVLNPARTDVVSIRRGGRLFISEMHGARTREVEILPATDGLRWRYSENGRTAPVDAGVRAWVGRVVRENAARGR